MADRTVINTGPLIAFARADALDLVDRLSSEGAWYDAELLRRVLRAVGE